jgi:CrcB protein
MFRTILLVGIGGGIGSIFRYLTAVYIQKNIAHLFPWATFTANILGCLIIGLLLGLSEKYNFVSSDLKYLFITGFCGGYTTFSTFMAENVSLIENGHMPVAFLNIAFSVLAGLAATWLGLYLVR